MGHENVQPTSTTRVLMTKAGKGYRSVALLIVAFSIAPSLVFAQNGQGNIYVRGRNDTVEKAGILRTGTMLPVDTPARTAHDVYPFACRFLYKLCAASPSLYHPSRHERHGYTNQFFGLIFGSS